MMPGIDDLLDRLTHRLRVDPVLRLEIMQELRSHLADSAAEYQEAGLDGAEATAEAIKHLGDTDELATQLWQANRRRISVRRAVWWAARAGLMPAALLVMVVALASSLATWNLYGVLMPRAGDNSRLVPFRILGSYASDAVGWLSDNRRPYQGLPEEDEFLFTGGEPGLSKFEVARRLTERWPDDPVYFANYVSQATLRASYRRGPTEAELAAMFQRGQSMYPDDSFYDYCEALALFLRSGQYGYRHRKQSSAFEYVWDGKTRDGPRFWMTQADITDAAVFEQAVHSLQRALDKRGMTSPGFEMRQRRAQVLPPASTLKDLLWSVRLGKWRWPEFDHIDFGHILLSGTLTRAERGDVDGAIELLNLLLETNEKETAHGAIVHGQIGRLLEDVIYRAEVYRLTGHPELAAEWESSLPQFYSTFADLITQARQGPWSETTPGDQGFIGGKVMDLPLLEKMDVTGVLRAEYSLADSAFLAAVVLVFLTISISIGSTTVARVLRFRRSKQLRPMLLFVGWGRIGRIMLLGLLVPAVVYALYCFMPPIAARAQSIRMLWPRQLMEYALLGTVIVCSVLALSVLAVRRKAIEVGLTVPSRKRHLNRLLCWAIAAIVLVAVLVYEIGWRAAWLEADPHFRMRCGVTVACTIPLIGLAWCLLYVYAWGGGPPGWRATMVRSIGPIVLIAAIVLGMGGGLTTWLVERQAVRTFDREADEIAATRAQTSFYREVLSQMKDEHDSLLTAWRAKHGT